MVDEQVTLSPDMKKRADKIIVEIRKQLSQYPSRKSLQLPISQRINTTTIAHGEKFSDSKPTRSTFFGHYGRLLQGKVVDDEMKKTSIKYAEITMQNRSYNQFTLYDKGTPKATIKLFLTLPDHTRKITNWWIGKEIEVTEFNNQVKRFEQYMIAEEGTGQTQVVRPNTDNEATCTSIVHEITLT